MGVPARGTAAGPAADDPDRKPDPRAAAWADVRQALIADSHLVALAAEQVAARPGDPAALAMLRAALQAFEPTFAIGCRWEVDEAVIEAERARAYADGVKACKAARCRMQVIDGGAG